MKTLRVLGLTLFGAAAAASNAQAVRSSLVDVAIIDRDTGARLGTHYYRGEYWVAGQPGARYAVEVRNRTGERLLAVMSVDGINVLSGATAGWDQAGYVFSPGDRYQITGWRKSDSEVAAFTFTDLPNSYAARTGRPANVGVIGVAIFRERGEPTLSMAQPPVSPAAPAPRPSAPPSDAGTAAPMPDATGTPAREAARPDTLARAQSQAQSALTAPLTSPLPGPKLGTGHGARESSYVSHTEFERLQAQPNDLIRVHYDSLENLMAMGIVTRPRAPWSSPDAFPASPEPRYVPDPPG